MAIVAIVAIVAIGAKVVIPGSAQIGGIIEGMVAQQKPVDMGLRQAAMRLCPDDPLSILPINPKAKSDEQRDALIARYDALFKLAVAEGSHAAAVNALNGIGKTLGLVKDGAEMNIHTDKPLQIIYFNKVNNASPA